MKNRSGPAKVLPLGISQGTPGNSYSWAIWGWPLAPFDHLAETRVLRSDDSSASDSSLDTVETAGHSNFPGFGGTERQGSRTANRAYG